MSFVFTQDHTFEWPVKIPVPADGGHDIVEITGLFAMVGDAEYVAMPDDITTHSAAIDADIARLKRVFKGWKEGHVLHPDKTPMAATDDAIAKFLMYRPNRMAVSDAYDAAVSPRDGYRAKN